MLGTFASCGLLVILGFLQFTPAQEPSGKPEAPAPKTIQAPLPLPKNSSAAAPLKKSDPKPETVGDLPALATSIAAYTRATACQPKACTVLVTDFVFPVGNTSTYGMRLSENSFRDMTIPGYTV